MVTPLIESVLNFLSFDSSLLPYTSTSIFLAKNMVERVRIGHGSGFYDIKVVDENIVNVEYDEKTRELVLKPLRMGDTKVKILDQCLKTEPSELLVRVVSIGKIAIDAPDRVEKTKQIEGIVRIFDTNHNLLNIDPNNLKIYEMTEDVQNKKILKLKQGDQDNLNRGEIR